VCGTARKRAQDSAVSKLATSPDLCTLRALPLELSRALPLEILGKYSLTVRMFERACAG